MAVAPNCMFDLLAVGHRLKIEFEESLLNPKGFNQKEFEEKILHSKDVLPVVDISSTVVSRW